MKHSDKLTDVSVTLQDRGWKIDAPIDSHSRMVSRFFYKNFPTKTPCRCNQKEGIQIGVTASVWDDHPVSFEVSVCGETIYGHWVKYLLYAIPGDLESALKLVPTILAAWEAAN